MVGLFLYVGGKPSTYGLPLSVTFVRPDQAVAPFQIPNAGKSKFFSIFSKQNLFF